LIYTAMIDLSMHTLYRWPAAALNWHLTGNVNQEMTYFKSNFQKRWPRSKEREPILKLPE